MCLLVLTILVIVFEGCLLCGVFVEEGLGIG